MAQAVVGYGIVWGQTNGMVKGVQGICIFLQFKLCITQIDEGGLVTRVGINGLLVRCLGLHKVFELEQNIALVVQCFGVARLQSNRVIETRDGVVMDTQRLQGIASVEINHGIFALVLQSTVIAENSGLVFAQRLQSIALPHECQRRLGAQFNGTPVHRQRLFITPQTEQRVGLVVMRLGIFGSVADGFVQ